MDPEKLFRCLAFVNDAGGSAELGALLSRFHLSIKEYPFTDGYLSWHEVASGAEARLTNKGYAWLMSEYTRRSEIARESIQRDIDRALAARQHRSDIRMAVVSLCVSSVVSVLALLIDHLFLR